MPRKPPSCIWIFLAADVVLTLAYLANHLAGRPPLAFSSRLLDLDGEANLPAWYSSMQWFCVALAFGIFALRHFSARVLTSWLLLGLPAVFLLMSIDEIAQIHEWVGLKSDALLPGGDRRATLFKDTGVWMFLIGLPFAAVFFSALYGLRGYFAGHGAALLRVCVGMGVMLGGAIGVEAVGNFLDPASAGHVLEVVAEELMEMLGATVILWGALQLLDGTRRP